MESRSADGRRKTIRESVTRLLLSARALFRWLSGMGGKRWIAGGANKSERDPVRSRAIVEVNATLVTWVDGSPAGGGALLE